MGLLVDGIWQDQWYENSSISSATITKAIRPSIQPGLFPLAPTQISTRRTDEITFG